MTFLACRHLQQKKLFFLLLHSHDFLSPWEQSHYSLQKLTLRSFPGQEKKMMNGYFLPFFHTLECKVDFLVNNKFCPNPKMWIWRKHFCLYDNTYVVSVSGLYLEKELFVPFQNPHLRLTRKTRIVFVFVRRGAWTNMTFCCIESYVVCGISLQ